MFTRISTTVLALGLMLSGSATASPQQTGQLTEVWVNDNSTSNVAFITLGITYASGCDNGNDRSYFVLDLNEPSMKEAYSLALSAFMSNTNVKLAGTANNGCIGLNEKLKYIYMAK